MPTKKGNATRNQINFSVPEQLSILVEAMIQKRGANLSNLLREFLQEQVNRTFDPTTQRAILDGEIAKRRAAGIPYEMLSEEILPKVETRQSGKSKAA